MSDSKPVILTGIRSNDEPTLGNYLGAFLPMVELQKKMVIDGEYELYMFVPDLHSFTTPINHDNLYPNTLRNLSYFIASGLDIDDTSTFIYRQSYIPAHSELTVILNNFAYFGELSRMTQFKDRQSAEENITAGLFDYPVLMAADILLYGAKYVPVGDDQQQHLEFTRDLGERFNNKFGEIFTLPDAIDKQLEFSGREEGVRIRSLRHPENKMSKSIEDPAGTILLSDSSEDARDKIMSATTDSLGKVNWDWGNQPGVTNLLQILQIISGKTRDEMIKEWQGSHNYGDLKKTVAESVASWLDEFHESLERVDPASIEAKLRDSEAKMTKVASEQLFKVQQAVGLRP